VALHTINKVVLDFSFEEEEKDNALAKTKHFFYADILPGITQNLEERTEYIYINRLEIDLGRTTLQNLRSDFLKTFEQSWKKCYPDHIIKTNASPQLGSINQLQSFSVHHFIFFLQKGYWPWNFQTKTEKELMGFIQALLKNDTQLTDLLQQFRSEKSITITRFRQFVFGKASLRKLLIQGLKTYHPALGEAGIVLEEYLQPRKIAGSFYDVFFNLLLSSAPLCTDNDIKKLMREIADKSLADQHENDQEKSLFVKRLYDYLENDKKPFLANMLFGVLKNLIEGYDKVPTFSKEKKDKEDASSSPAESETDQININNSGLVLFHPYLRQVFKELKWTNNKDQFINSKTQQRAILFLQYLINGKSRQQEHELVLNKIFCNWKLNVPLATSCNFSIKEKLAAYELNKSLREHWRSLKNTSASGLIKSFVERKGTIHKEAKNFLLRVEKNSIDILMESLPFGIQTIKLPWNEYIIHTEWTY